VGLGVGSPALAAPFDDLAERLEQYDEGDVPRQSRTSSRDDYEDEQEAPRPSRTRGRFASYPAETVTPEPDAGPAPPEHYDEGSVWDEGYGGCDSCGGCGDCGECFDCCGLGNCECRRFWGRAEYLQWWVRGSQTPALVTTSPDNTPVGAAGVLPGATILFGDGRLNSNTRSGGRFTLGYWLDSCESLGVENTFFFLANENDSFSASSDGSPIIARPFFNTETGREDSVLVGYPEIVIGSINVTTYSRVYGNEINLRRALYFDACRRVDLLAGYRFFQLAEQLQVQENKTSIQQGGTVPVGTTFNILDSFHTKSNFHGGQLGINTRLYGNCWSIDLLAKVALGGLTQQVTIDGSTIVTAPGTAPVTNRGGILAQNSNMGAFNRGRFSVIPEFGINAHRQLGRCWQVNVGYTFLFVSNVVRPGDQIDIQLDPRQFPPPTSQGPFTAPAFAFQETDVWLQGINVGLEYNF
jgi:hypothetical protein